MHVDGPEIGAGAPICSYGARHNAVTREPLVSICIPSYKRPELVVRAVRSAFCQTYRNIEVVVSDDEGPDSATAEMLRRTFLGNERLRIINNPGERGQIGNTNNALQAANGKWIKLLHDDDALKPACIEKLMQAVEAYPEALLVSCRADRFFEGKLVRGYEREDAPYLEMAPPDQAPLASYLMCDLGGSLPSQQFVRKSVIDAGILFELHGSMHTLVDSCWNAKVRAQGQFLILNESLIEWHQGRHDTVTSTVKLDALDQEFVDFRDFIYGYISNKEAAPPPQVVKGFVRLVRALARLKRGHFDAAWRLIRQVPSIRSYILCTRHLAGLPPASVPLERVALWNSPLGDEQIIEGVAT